MQDIWYRGSKFYLIILGIAVIASLKASISFALLNLFIPEQNLPIELGIAKILGEQGAVIINRAIDTIIWFAFIITGYRLYKHLGRKKFIIFLILSPILWLIGSYSIALIDIYILGNFKLNIFGSSCSGTGYPIARNICQKDTLHAFYFLNISFWFFVIWFIWEQILKRIHRVVMMTQKS